jgi:ElaB/YqjD/DUF883 family membrane-anchored ribosome-binding protein
VDEGTRQGSPAVEETRSPEEIRADIDRTRLELGDTVEALGKKTDVKGQAQERIEGAKSQARQKVDSIKQRATNATPSSAREAASTATAKAKSNPVPVAMAAGVFFGFLIGRITKGDGR